MIDRREYRIPLGGGDRPVQVDPEGVGWQMLEFWLERRARGGVIEGQTLERELCLVFMAGDATVAYPGGQERLRGRRSVFGGLPHALYLPPDAEFRIEAESDLEVAFAAAPAEGFLAPRLITPDEVRVEMRGGHNVQRQITHVLDPGDAEHLLCVEVYTPSGNWSSYPPHRHDVQAPPDEVDLDEIYHYRIDPPDGWALQRLYNDDGSLDEVVVARDGDTVLVREGYHPVVAAPGYDAYYLNFLAGVTPSWIAHDEPALAWVRGSWEGKPNRLRLPLVGTGR